MSILKHLGITCCCYGGDDGGC